jgi:hypothetical protein
MRAGRDGRAKRSSREWYFASMIVITQRLGEASLTCSTDRTMLVNVRASEPIVPDFVARLPSRNARVARSALLQSVT